MNNGILLIGLGHPYYGKMAAALAATIRCVDRTIPIHLAHGGNALKYLDSDELNLFSTKSLVPDVFYTVGSEEKFIRSKMFINKLSPYNKTIFLDSDLLWLKKQPTDLFNELDGCNISYQNYGYVDLSSENIPADYTLWANVNEVKNEYQLNSGKYYQVHSELFYWEKNKITNKFFSQARLIYDTLKVKATVFAGSIPDELPYAIASAKLNIYPHQDNFTPSYWAKAKNRRCHIYQISPNYYTYSMAGNSSGQQEIENYNLLVKAAYQKLGLRNPYQWKNKKSFLKERKSL